ncbi:Alpha/Beta hydrolase protein [Pilobolus umbonatus]|nr:Alpha/Beta hydrolase protein [Pilobolus umbonatus]
MSLLALNAVEAYYISTVYVAALLTVVSFTQRPVRKLLTEKLEKLSFVVEIFASFLVELSLQLIVFKLILIQVTSYFVGFTVDHILTSLAYYVDILTIGGLIILYTEMMNEKSLAEACIREINKSAKPLQSFVSTLEISKIINPFWSPKNINRHKNTNLFALIVSYATNEEIREALVSTNFDYKQPKRLMLDVYTSTKKSEGLRPVLIHFHGGAWRLGSKDHLYPHEQILITESDWVVVNAGYRLAPQNAYPTHLMDVKRAIRWVKANISAYGGNPEFIVLSGDSAGGHLSSMASLTANDPQYQPGFEDVDTSVQGVVSFSGAVDLFHGKSTSLFFSIRVANLKAIDNDFVRKHSPASVIKSTHPSKLVPTLLLAGDRDLLVQSDQARIYKKSFDEATNSGQCRVFTNPHGKHINFLSWSPRSYYNARVVQAWCDQLSTRSQ